MADCTFVPSPTYLSSLSEEVLPYNSSSYSVRDPSMNKRYGKQTNDEEDR